MNYLKEFNPFCRLLVLKSGDIIKKYFRAKISVDLKEDDSPVTIADKKSEELIRSIIEKEFPEHGIVGEEFGVTNPEAEYKWIIDPIDGTKSFICGTVTFGTLIALTKNDKPILGVFNQPILNQFLIGDNSIALLNDEIVKVRACNKIEDAVLLTTDHLLIEKYQNISAFEALIKKVKLYRQWGDCYGYYLVATGYADIMIDPIMHVWDSMAIIPIINGASGTITDYQGGDPTVGNSIVASSSQIHLQIISLLNKK